MENLRKVFRLMQSKATIEGAGVHLKRVFGNFETQLLDPFLLMDDFGSDDPADYMAGFPWHPHRGIETVTYMLRGKVEHQDSLGNKGIISDGDVQWMTAGSGIIHQEMPKETDGLMRGFQLWVNLPKVNKMMTPRYRGISHEEITNASIPPGVDLKVISGEFNGSRGPVQDLVVDVTYMDITLQPNMEYVHPVPEGLTAFAYAIDGSGSLDPFSAEVISNGTLVIFDQGDTIKATTGDDTFRFLLLAGKPLKETIAWAGPIVMNTQEELRIAFSEYNQGTFIK